MGSRRQSARQRLWGGHFVDAVPHAPFVDVDLGPPLDAAIVKAGLEMQRDRIIAKAMEAEEVGWDVLGRGSPVEREGVEEDWELV